MSWLHSKSGSDSAFEGVLGLRPDLLERYRSFYGAIWDGELLSARLLEMCRLRIAGIHGCDSESSIAHRGAEVSREERAVLRRGGIPDTTSELERRALELAARVPFEIHALEDDQVAALRRHLGDPGLVALLVALPLFDANCRLRVVLEIEPTVREVERPASKDATLY